MFLEYFKLQQQPFGVTPDPRFLFPSPGHREALASLIYGIESNLGFGSLIAAPGMGKTTLLFHILERYRQSARTAFIFNTQCNSYDLLRSVVNELDDNPAPQEVFQLHERIKQILASEGQARRRVILVIDEAQNLGDMVMETIRLLSNFESANLKLLHIVLAGQPELAGKLNRRDLSQLEQRIPIITTLQCFSREETVSYIDHRLRVAGYQGRGLFTPEALERIAWLSRGVPREINRLCFNCLSLACASSKPMVDVHVIAEVASDLDLNSRAKQSEEREETAFQRAGAGMSSAGAARPVENYPRPATFTSQPALSTVNPPRLRTVPRRGPLFGIDSFRQRTADVRQRPKSFTTQRPARTAFSSSWWTYRRPVGFALFYLILIAGGWAAITRWGYPDSPSAETAASTTGPTNTVAARPVADKSNARPFNKRSASSGRRKAKRVVTSAAETEHASRASGPADDAPSQAASAPATPPLSSDSPVAEPATSSDPPPELLKYVRPQYPGPARERHIEGTVVLSAVVAKDGTVRGVKPVSGDPMLIKAAESAVRGWVYRPYRVNGKAIDVDTEIVISFSLPKENNP